MITVHHLEQSRSQRILWLLEELELPYELKVYRRHPKTLLAPPELKQVHPMGKSPVITDKGLVVAESAAILEYLAQTYAPQTSGSGWVPPPGTPERLQYNFWMHFAEGSLMNWLVMKLVFMTIPKQPMPFFVRPIARQLCLQVQRQLVDPNVSNAVNFMEKHLGNHTWFAGERLTLADMQMSFAVEAALSRQEGSQALPHLSAYRQRMVSRPAYQRGIAKGGPVMPG